MHFKYLATMAVNRIRRDIEKRVEYRDHLLACAGDGVSTAVRADHRKRKVIGATLGPQAT